MNAAASLAGLPAHWRIVPVAGKRPIGGHDWPSKAVRVDAEPELPPGADGWGVILGRASRIIDVECDGPEAEAAYARLIGQDGRVCPTWQSARGRHRVFAWDDRLSVLPAVIKLTNDLEVRIGHDRAQSVLPPAGGRRWLVHPSDCDPPPLPQGLWEAIAHRNGHQAEKPNRPPEDMGDGEPIPEGRRNQTLTRMAGAMRRRGMTVEEIAAALSVVNARRCRPPLAENEVWTIARSVARYEPADDATAQAPYAQKASVASRLITLALERAEVWHTPDGEAWATIPRAGHREHWPVRSKAFRAWLAEAFFDLEEAAPNAQALQDALGTIEGHALFRGPSHRVFVRVAHTDEAVYLDMADDQWRAIQITAGGWRVVEPPAVRFARRRGMLPLPEPEPGGHVSELRPLLNVGEDVWPLLAAWLVATLSRGPYAALALHGEPGAAKSTAARLLRSVVDPHEAGLRAPPKEPRDLAIAAHNGWIVALDNLGGIPEWLSDALCRLTSGAGFATRELYSDDVERIFTGKRPVILTGIPQVVTRSDLADRAILLELAPIPEEARQREAEIDERFQRVHPRVLAGLCTAAATALARQKSVRLDRLPRMADFAIWAAAAAPGLGLDPSAVITSYCGNRELARREVVESHPVGTVLCRWAPEVRLWTGAAADLLTELAKEATDSERQAGDWPRTARGLTATLKRLAPALRGLGVWVRRAGTVGRGEAKRAAWEVSYRTSENTGN